VVAIVVEQLTSSQIDHLFLKKVVNLLVVYFSLSLTCISDASGVPPVLVIARGSLDSTAMLSQQTDHIPSMQFLDLFPVIVHFVY